MEAVGPSLPSFAISSLSRVTSASLDPQKHWYVLQKEICGVRPTDFSILHIFLVVNRFHCIYLFTCE